MNPVALLPHLDLEGVAWVNWLSETNLDSLEEGWIVVGVLLDDGADRNAEGGESVQDWLAGKCLIFNLL